MNVFGPSMTALRAFSTKLASTANNIANVQSVGYNAQRVHMVEIPGGGVSVTVSRDLTPGPSLPEPSGTRSTGRTRQGSNVDLAREMVDLITTERYYQANARTLRTLAETKGRVLDIIG